MAAYTAQLLNPSAELDSVANVDDTEEGHTQTALERAIVWCESQLAQHVPPNYQEGWTARVVEDATQAVVWPE
jgi:apolipoprotein N-acyltransferase